MSLFKTTRLFQQHGIADCGPCCLCSLAGHYGKRVDIGYVRRISATGREGTTVLGMSEGARKLGIRLDAVRTDLSEWDSIQWQELPVPAIVHLSKKNGLQHFVVAYGTSDDAISYMDPADGRMHECSFESFASECSGVFLLAGKAPDFSTVPAGTGNTRFLLSLIAEHRRYVLVSFVCSILIMALSFAQALLSGWVTDRLAGHGNMEIRYISLVFLGIVMLLFGFNAFSIGYHAMVSKQIDNSLVGRLCGHLFRLPASFFDSISVGEVVSRFLDVSRIKGYVTEGLSGLALGVFTVIGTVIVLFSMSLPLGLCAIGLIPAYTLVCWHVNRYLKRNRTQMMEAQALMTSGITEHVTMAMKTRQLCWQDGVSEKLQKAYERFTSVSYGGMVRMRYARLLIQTVCSIATIFIIVVSSFYISLGVMTLGKMVVAMTVFTLYVSSIVSVIGFVISWPEIRSAADRLSDIMSVEQERQGGVELVSGKSFPVEFRDVCFAYGYGMKVLDGFSFKACPGKITLIKGRNGIGKSTTARLILNMYDADSGKILIGGISVSDISTISLRKTVGYCEQPAALYNASIRDNILCGQQWTDEEVERVLRRTGFDLSRYSLDMMVGEGGKSLSGGESQRISIARMLIRKPQILVLDEPTAFADAEGTACIMDILMEERDSGRTVIVISHDDRLDTMADHIFNLR